jgi:Zinc carboxypeptidase
MIKIASHDFLHASILRFAAIMVGCLITMDAMSTDADWITPAETSHFKTTPSYADTHAYLERLAAAAPDTIKLTRFGVSPEGRDLMLVVAASGGEFTPQAARKSGKQILMVQAGIHSGEIEGKDAGLMLLRDLTVGKKWPHLLDHTVLVYLPIFNVDGHENSSPYNRINQNGPESMGFRATAQNLNLNRDYLKADAPEMRDWLKLFHDWLPDFFVDVHTTNGADYQYDLTWYTEDWGPLDPVVMAWQHSALKQRVFPATEKRGHLLSQYLELKDHRDISKGIVNFGSGPRFSTGYVALQNRAALLVETHMLKPYDNRVHSTYDLIVSILDEFRTHPGELRKAVEKADQNTIARKADAEIAIAFKTADQSVQYPLKGVDYKQTHSEISNDTWVEYDPNKPKTIDVPFWQALVPTKSVNVPAAYIVPAAWTQIIEKLQQHGIEFTRLDKPMVLDVEHYQLDQPKWATAPFEGRLMLRSFDEKTETGRVEFPAGSVIVRLDQRAANVAVHLLEPDAPDSLLRWGFLNAIFEEKEYGDARVLETLARDMLAKDPALKRKFDDKLANDKAFADDPEARLEFFYRRSPWYAQQKVGAYPVARLGAAALAAIRK